MANILVLDDVPDAVSLIERILREKGHRVFGFTDEEEAVACARQHHIDLAVLDIKLKKMSGLEVLEELKGIAPAIRVMMMTAYPNLESVREAVRLGADDYCVKPLEVDELEEKVAAVLDRIPKSGESA
ncbi:MAG: response regulator [Acidobacteriota bacterium]